MLTKSIVEVTDLTLQDLKRSGIEATKQNLKDLHIEPLTGDMASSLLKAHCSYGYAIYYNHRNGTINKDVYRVKVLDPWFENRQGKTIKYMSPKGALPRVFFPPAIITRQMPNAISTATTTIFITEGEKKAIYANMMGIRCMALSGVWNFRAAKRKIDLIDDLFEGYAKKHRFCIVFDNDLYEKHNVQKAREELAFRLMEKGFEVFIKDLPEGGAKGLDDFLIAQGSITKAVKAFNALPDIEAKELIMPETEQLLKLNEYYAFVNEAGRFIRLVTNSLAYAKSVEDEIAANCIWTEDEKRIPLYKFWRESPMRRNFESMVYRPGEPYTVYDPDLQLENCLNTWKGFAVKSEKGSVEIFKKHVKTMCNGDTELFNYVMRWLGYPIKYPGTKLKTAILLISTEHQVGKSFIGRIMCELYGEHNARMIDGGILTSGWGNYLKEKQFLAGDELFSDRRFTADNFKSYITEPKVYANMKGSELCYCRNYVNFWLTSNNPNPTYIDEHDKRYTVIRYHGSRLTDDHYTKLDDFRSKGLSALRYYFENTLDYDDFNEFTLAMETEDKEAVRELSLRPQDLWLKQCLQNNELHIPEEPRAVDAINSQDFKRLSKPRAAHTATDLATLYLSHTGKEIDTRMMGAAANRLSMAGKVFKIRIPSSQNKTTGKKKQSETRSIRLWFRNQAGIDDFIHMTIVKRGEQLFN